MELRNYSAILWRRKWVIAITVAVTMTVVFIGTLVMRPTYSASVTMRVSSASNEDLTYNYYMFAERLLNTSSIIATSSPVLEELATRLDLDEPPNIEVEIIPNTELLQITVESHKSDVAALAANTLAEILVNQNENLHSGGGTSPQEILAEQLDQIEAELIQAREEYDVLLEEYPGDSERLTAASRSIALKEDTYAMLLEQYAQTRIRQALRANSISVVEPAIVPEKPSSPKLVLNLALGFMVGLAGGLGLAFLFENLDNTLYTTEQIEAVTELPVLGKIPGVNGRRKVTMLDGNSLQAEAFRRLRTNIAALELDDSLKTLLVTSAELREGKSMIVANFAIALAHSRRKVIVVDCDLRQPNLHKIFNLPNEVGLSNILSQAVPLEEALQDGYIRVGVITSGPLPINPAGLIGSPKMVTLIDQLTELADVVLLDTPALLAVSDATVLAPAVDGVLLVVKRAQASEENVHDALQYLESSKARTIGVVVNQAEQNGINFYYPQKTAE
jgi:non-specific protein-tyrosine kinase